MFEWLFKYPPSLFAQGDVAWSPVFSQDATVGGWLLAAILAALVVSGLRGRRAGALSPAQRLSLGALQGLFLVGVVLMLGRPSLEIATLTPGANTVAVLLDVSESMSLPAERAGDSRLAAARTVIDEALRPALSGLGEIATFSFGDIAQRDDLTAVAADQPRTRLVAALESVVAGFRGAPLAAVVVLSDGADNGDGGLDLANLAASGIPVHTVGVGPAELPGEVEIADVALPTQAPPNSRVVAQVTLRHGAGGPVRLKVRDGDRLLAVTDATLAAGVPAERLAVAFDSGPGGIRELSFKVEAPAGDRLVENNRLDRLLTVNERRRRVLYLEGEPRWEYKFIRRALAGDQVLALTSWLRTTDRKTYRQDLTDPQQLSAGFPETLAALYGYDVIVLGSLDATYLTDTQHAWLESFVAVRGGSLLALAGREALADGGWDVKPLADALPVMLERRDGGTYEAVQSQVRLTREGARSAITQLAGGEGGDPWQALPPLADYQRLGTLKPAASSLLDAVTGSERRPLLVTQPYGLGTSAVLATASTWRWRMRTPADDQRHLLFWRQLVRQLAETAQRPRDLSLQVENDAVTVRLAERDARFAPKPVVAATAAVTGPDLHELPLTLTPADIPGVVSARFRPPAPGVYRVDVAVDDPPETLTRFVRVGSQQQEYFDARRNTALLERIAAATGGRYWRPEEAGGVARALRFSANGVTHREQLALWDMPAAFLLLLLLKGSEWLLRRRWGSI